jgi:hypothetical protein
MNTYPTGYYVYAYLRKSDLTPYYIGKGKGHRAWAKDHNVCVPDNNSRIIIVESNLTDIGACAIERKLIEWYGRKDLGTGILRNLTDGGNGTAGRIQTQQTRNLISRANSRRIWSEESKQKLRDHNRGIKQSPESNAKRSQALKGRKVSLTYVSCACCKKTTILTNFIRWHKDCYPMTQVSGCEPST